MSWTPTIVPTPLPGTTLPDPLPSCLPYASLTARVQVNVNRVFSQGGAFATTCVPDPSALSGADAGTVAGTVLADTGTVDLVAPSDISGSGVSTLYADFPITDATPMVSPVMHAHCVGFFLRLSG
jgi:hypothetical protein